MPDAARYVHWGATSQDIIDTGLVLQLREAVPALVRDLRRAATAAAGHAQRHASTPMAGRTWLQQATPITFGLKAAGWLDALARARPTASRRRSRRARGPSVRRRLGHAGGARRATASTSPTRSARCSTLPVPPSPWHAHRDRLATLACALGVACGTLGKIARDLALLGQTEVGEAVESPAEAGRLVDHAAQAQSRACRRGRWRRRCARRAWSRRC